jgi:hypothetical protein
MSEKSAQIIKQENKKYKYKNKKSYLIWQMSEKYTRSN